MQWVFWYWWILAAVLAAAEIFAPGAGLIWMAAAAVLVGGLLYLFPEMVFELQLLLWAVLSGVAVFAWRAWFKRYPQPTDEPALNRRGSAYVGRQLVLSQSIENGVGKVKVDDTTWKVVGEDAPRGSKVKVTGVEGVALVVQRV